jgi:dynein heavy chain
MSGQVKGLTLLPLPVGTERITPDDEQPTFVTEAQRNAVVHSIESAVIDWTHQVWAVFLIESVFSGVS